MTKGIQVADTRPTFIVAVKDVTPSEPATTSSFSIINLQSLQKLHTAKALRPLHRPELIRRRRLSDNP